MSIEYAIDHIQERGIAILRIQGHLDFPTRGLFQTALAELQACEASKLVINMSKITKMSSLYLGTLIDFGNTAQRLGKGFSLMIPKNLSRVCTEVGLDSVAQIILVED